MAMRFYLERTVQPLNNRGKCVRVGGVWVGVAGVNVVSTRGLLDVVQQARDSGATELTGGSYRTLRKLWPRAGGTESSKLLA